MKFPAAAATTNAQRVAFLRKSGCRNATRITHAPDLSGTDIELLLKESGLIE